MKKFKCKNIKIFTGFLVLVVLAACQKNPDEDFVVNKSKTVLDKAVDNGDNSNNLASQSFSESFHGGDREVTIEVDIKMGGINQKLAILRCIPKDIEVSDIKLWSETFLGSSKVYEPISTKTKSQIETQILSLKQRISNRDGLLAEYEYDENAVNSYIEYVEQLIASLESAYPSAPEGIERKETDWAFHNYLYCKRLILG